MKEPFRKAEIGEKKGLTSELTIDRWKSIATRDKMSIRVGATLLGWLPISESTTNSFFTLLTTIRSRTIMPIVRR